MELTTSSCWANKFDESKNIITGKIIMFVLKYENLFLTVYSSIKNLQYYYNYGKGLQTPPESSLVPGVSFVISPDST